MGKYIKSTINSDSKNINETPKSSKYFKSDNEKTPKSAYFKTEKNAQSKSSKYFKTSDEPKKKSKYLKISEKDKVIKPDNKTDSFKQNNNIIKSKVKGSEISYGYISYSENIKTHYESKKTFFKIFYTAVIFLCCISLIFIVIFSSFKSKNVNTLNDRLNILNYYESILSDKNKEYFNNISTNPELYNILSSNRYFENNFFKYSITIKHANNKLFYEKNGLTNYILSLNNIKSNTITVEITESYTDEAKQRFSLQSLRNFSLFVNPIQTQDIYTLKDYRQFFNVIPENFSYLNEKTNTPNFTVNAVASETSNSYIFKIINFKVSDEGYIPSIMFGLNNDSSSERNFTDNSDITQFNFKLPLAENTLSEKDAILTYINSINKNYTASENDLMLPYDTAINTSSINSIISKAISNTSVSLLNIINGESIFYIDSLIENSADINTSFFTSEIKTLLESFLIIPTENEYNQLIIKQNLTDKEKEKIAYFKSALLIKNLFGTDFNFSDTERAQLNNIISLDGDYTVLTDEEIAVLEKIKSLYDKDKLLEMKTVIYKIKSFIKPYDLLSKTGYSSINIYRGADNE